MLARSRSHERENSTDIKDSIQNFIESSYIIMLNSTADRIIGETGVVNQFDHSSQTIFFDHNYDNPVIFAQPLSYNGPQSAIVRIEDVQSDRFTAFLQEPRNLDGKHTRESFSYVVLEQGTWELEDDTVLEVGAVNTDLLAPNGWKDVDFTNDFTRNPVVFSQVQTDNGRDFVRTRQRNTNADGFQLTMEEEEAFNNSGHNQETVGWLAISAGSGNWSQNNYKVGTTGDSFDHNWNTIDFGRTFSQSPQPPVFLASIATYDGSDPSGLRYSQLSNDEVKIKIEEDTTKDKETKHTTEVVSFLALAGNNPLRGSAIGEDKEFGSTIEEDEELIFKSGFEGSTKIVPHQDIRHTIKGQDGNFSWETDLPQAEPADAYNGNSRSPRFFYLDTGGKSADPWVDTRIEKVIGHDGKPTNALYMGVKGDYPSGDDAAKRTRNEFSLYPPTDFKQGYVSYWMKLQENYKDVWPEGYGQRMVMELKERSDMGLQQYRTNITVERRGEELFWGMNGIQTLPNVDVEFSAVNTDIPVPTGEWFKIEMFFRQGDENNGRLWFAVNGQEIADYRGRTQHESEPQPLHFWSIFKLYTNTPWFETGANQYQWIDDVEIRSDFPTSNGK